MPHDNDEITEPILDVEAALRIANTHKTFPLEFTSPTTITPAPTITDFFGDLWDRVHEFQDKAPSLIIVELHDESEDEDKPPRIDLDGCP